MYISRADVCEGMLRLGIDYVYSSHRLGTQSSISQVLNDNVGTVRDIISTHSKECVRQVFQLLCSYYLPSCGNATHTESPSSICEEECVYVQETCRGTWQAIVLVFNDLDPFLICEDTSQLIFPLPNCCTGAGIIIPSPTSELNFSLSIYEDVRGMNVS